MQEVEIFTDGGCRGNPGIGGWGALLRFGNIEKELSGSAQQATNNRMELTAAIEALRALKRPCKVTLTTDSQYVKNGGVSGWQIGSVITGKQRLKNPLRTKIYGRL